MGKDFFKEKKKHPKSKRRPFIFGEKKNNATMLHFKRFQLNFYVNSSKILKAFNSFSIELNRNKLKIEIKSDLVQLLQRKGKLICFIFLNMTKCFRFFSLFLRNSFLFEFFPIHFSSPDLQFLFFELKTKFI